MPGGMLGPPYVSAAGRAKMSGYQYSGRDLSLYYRYVQSPLCDRLVQGLPRWLAPNAITLAGLACTACATAAMLGHSAGLRGEPGRHPWVYYLQAACHIAYQTLDNMDGKQARRTGNASPLGLLFDHGIDAVNYTLMDLGCLTVMQMGGTWGALVLTIAGSMGFYAATWEQMFSGTFTLTVRYSPSSGSSARLTDHSHFLPCRRAGNQRPERGHPHHLPDLRPGPAPGPGVVGAGGPALARLAAQ